MILNLTVFTWMLSNEILRSAELDDGSKASWPRRPCPSPSQRRQLDNFNYSDDGGLANRRCCASEGPRPLRQCAKLTSQSPSQKRSGAVAPTLVWGEGIICSNSPTYWLCLPSRYAPCACSRFEPLVARHAKSISQRPRELVARPEPILFHG
jgi:hypothetical protein